MEEGPVQKTQAVWIVCSVDTTGGNFRSLYDTVINWIQGSAAHCFYLSHLFLISSKGVRTKQDNGEGLKNVRCSPCWSYTRVTEPQTYSATEESRIKSCSVNLAYTAGFVVEGSFGIDLLQCAGLSN